MLRRFYSHYTFIYPDIYLKNVVVELDSANRIKLVFPFEKEIEKTEFYSGWLYFVDIQENIPCIKSGSVTSLPFSDSNSALIQIKGKTFVVINQSKRIISNICV